MVKICDWLCRKPTTKKNKHRESFSLFSRRSKSCTLRFWLCRKHKKKHKNKKCESFPLSKRSKSCARRFGLCRKQKTVKINARVYPSQSKLKVTSVEFGCRQRKIMKKSREFARVSPFPERIKRCMRKSFPLLNANQGLHP